MHGDGKGIEKSPQSEMSPERSRLVADVALLQAIRCMLLLPYGWLFSVQHHTRLSHSLTPAGARLATTSTLTATIKFQFLFDHVTSHMPRDVHSS